MNLYYAGIGSRATPRHMLSVMVSIANVLGKHGWTLRSGGARGADTAFHEGCKRVSGKAEIYQPFHATPEAIEMAAKYHPAWHKCNDYTKKLHARNCQIILGRNLDMPAHAVFCYTDPTLKRGGTKQGIAVALDYNIPVYNLHSVDVDVHGVLESMLDLGSI